MRKNITSWDTHTDVYVYLYNRFQTVFNCKRTLLLSVLLGSVYTFFCPHKVANSPVKSHDLLFITIWEIHRPIASFNYMYPFNFREFSVPVPMRWPTLNGLTHAYRWRKYLRTDLQHANMDENKKIVC